MFTKFTGMTNEDALQLIKQAAKEAHNKSATNSADYPTKESLLKLIDAAAECGFFRVEIYGLLTSDNLDVLKQLGYAYAHGEISW